MATAGLTDDADTPRSTLASRYVRILLTCWHYRHQADADLQSLVDGGRGDVPLARLRWRCARCRSDRVNMICKMSRLLLAILVVGCTPEHPFDHEASVLRLLAQERAQRQEQQGEEVKQLGFNRCYRLLADVPADAFSRGFLTPQEQYCYNAQELN